MELESFIGPRFVQLRSDLSERTRMKWTQTHVAEATGLTLNQVTRLESSSGPMTAFMKLCLFYYAWGYDINWIMVPDNENMPMVRPSEEEMEPSDQVEAEYEAYLESLTPKFPKLPRFSKLPKLFK